jgi:hypothetical protein
MYLYIELSDWSLLWRQLRFFEVGNDSLNIVWMNLKIVTLVGSICILI